MLSGWDGVGDIPTRSYLRRFCFGQFFLHWSLLSLSKQSASRKNGNTLRVNGTRSSLVHDLSRSVVGIILGFFLLSIFCLEINRAISISFSTFRVLILHLKRYSFNVALSLNHKVGQQVVIPRYLTLLSHCTESTRLPLTLGWSAHSAM